MIIAGGVYHEACLEPRSWSEMYGSGGRAAAALGQQTASITLHTYIEPAARESLADSAALFDFAVEANDRPVGITFSYVHALSAPTIKPAPMDIPKCASIRAGDDVVLRFGFMEGDAVVSGKRVVYDPQSAFDPRPFHENGSEADELAVVLNRAELRKLTGRPDIAAGAKLLLTQPNTAVVVVKMGPDGAFVCTSSRQELIPAFRTRRVFPLGSGDIFAATFALRWSRDGLTPVEAARQASLATAFYCSQLSLPLPSQDALERFGKDLPLITPRPARKTTTKTVYLAAPFFDFGQRWVVNEARHYLREAGFKVFSPYHDVGRGPAARVVEPDLKGLERSDIVLAIVDGLDPGVLFELGWARRKGIPIIALAERSQEEDTKMLQGTGCAIVGDFVTAIYTVAWEVRHRA